MVSAARPGDEVNNFLLLRILVMFVHRVKITNEVRMIEFQFRSIEGIRHNYVVLSTFLLENFHSIALSYPSIDGLD